MDEVVIVGAGLAGAAAALCLSKAGVSSLVLDARDRVGGRAFSRSFQGEGDEGLLEFGGSWIKPDHARIRALVAEMGLMLEPRPPVSTRLYAHDSDIKTFPFSSPAEWQAHQKAVAQVVADAFAFNQGHNHDAAGRSLSPLSYADYLDRLQPPQATRDLFNAWWTVSGSGFHDAVAATEFLSSCAYSGGIPEAMIDQWCDTVKPGMAVLARRMIEASACRLQLAHKVARIKHDDAAVVITLQDGTTVTAGHVILALGINMMKDVTFAPALPRLPASAVARGHQGRAFKLWIKLRGVLPGSLITGISTGIELLFAERLCADGTVLAVGFGIQGADADPGNADWVKHSLHRLCPGAQYVSHDWHDWLNDPLALGSWVSCPVEGAEAFGASAWQPVGRLSFASSDYAPDQAGWFEGAVLSGEAAALALVAHS